jgi:hypothetical protein
MAVEYTEAIEVAAVADGATVHSRTFPAVQQWERLERTQQPTGLRTVT